MADNLHRRLQSSAHQVLVAFSNPNGVLQLGQYSWLLDHSLLQTTVGSHVIRSCGAMLFADSWYCVVCLCRCHLTVVGPHHILQVVFIECLCCTVSDYLLVVWLARAVLFRTSVFV